MSLVIDASVACKWFIEEAGSIQAADLLKSSQALIAPDLVVPEVCNVAWRKLRLGELEPEHAEAMVAALPGFIDEFIPSILLSPRALAIARSLDYSVYDCFYIALAEQSETQLVTEDARLTGRVAGSDWEGTIISLAAVAQGN